MGTSFVSTLNVGIIPRAAMHLFERIQQYKAEAKTKGVVEPMFEISVQFIELYNEEIIDLLAEERRNNAIKIHEDPLKGEIYLKGVVSAHVTTSDSIMEALQNGALNRTTAATNMNASSSRSHAIFTIMIKQQRMVAMEVKNFFLLYKIFREKML